MPIKSVQEKTGQLPSLPPLIEIRGLSVKLGSELILDHIDLEIAAGSIHAVIGPNGAGKTTLLRSIMGGMPHRGTIRFFFRNNARIGYVPQLLDFDRSLPITVCDFFRIMLEKKPVFLSRPKKQRQEIIEALSQTESAHLIDRKIGGLSGGELRRILLAQALTPLPEFLILDEPASSIDEYGARLFEQLLTYLRSEHHLTVIMVAHDISMVSRVSDFATGLNRRITYQGDAKRLSDPKLLDRVFGANAPANNSIEDQG